MEEHRFDPEIVRDYGQETPTNTQALPKNLLLMSKTVQAMICDMQSIPPNCIKSLDGVLPSILKRV